MSQEGSLEYTINLELDADYMHTKSTLKRDNPQGWQDFVEKLLMNVCAARNSPSLDPENRDQQLWWIINVKLDNKGSRDDEEFSHRFDDKLVNLLPSRGSLCDVYMMKMDHQKGVLRMDILASTGELSTKDYKTTQSTNKGLRDSSALTMDYICNCMYKTPRMDTDMAVRPQELENLRNGQPLPLSEDARLQFKQLKKEDTRNVRAKAAQAPSSGLSSGEDYVKRIWCNSKRNLSEYISAFTKIRNGGAIYYGIRESEDANGCIVDGLCLNEPMKRDIRKGICHNIRHDMLWMERDTDSEKGFKELKPDDIRCEGEEEPAQDQRQRNEDPMQSQCHCAVDFIRVQDPSSSQAKYVLEVRVAPFNGVVFYDPQGPEAYRMEKKEGKFEPVRVSKGEWLEKMREHGWCSKHRVKKDSQCIQCSLENKNARDIPSSERQDSS